MSPASYALILARSVVAGGCAAFDELARHMHIAQIGSPPTPPLPMDEGFLFRGPGSYGPAPWVSFGPDAPTDEGADGVAVVTVTSTGAVTKVEVLGAALPIAIRHDDARQDPPADAVVTYLEVQQGEQIHAYGERWAP